MTFGPWLGDHTSGAGIWKEDGGINLHQGPYKVYVEDFTKSLVDGDLALSGATVTDVGTPTTPTETVTNDNGYLLLDPGTSVDDGIEVQFDPNVANGTAANDVRPLNILGPITSTTTLMDAREIWFQTRVGFRTDALANFDGHVLIGWFVKDTSLLTVTSGVPSVLDGGGFGFYINGDDGNPAVVEIIPVSDGAAIIAAPVRGTNSVPTTAVLPDLVVDLTANDTFVWYTLGAKMRVVDASAFTGVTTFYINRIEVGTVTDSCCMDSTQVYSMSFAVQNGPIDTIDVAVDYLITGITRQGLTVPYDANADVASI